MQAKKRYILVFISCAFLAYCYFGGYRLKRSRITFSPNGSGSGGIKSNINIRRYENIVVPPNLPSFLSTIECNGMNDDDFNTNSNKYEKSKGTANTHHSHMNSNDDAFRQGSQLSSATVQTNAKLKVEKEEVDVALQPISNNQNVPPPAQPLPPKTNDEPKVQVPVVELPAIANAADAGNNVDGLAKTFDEQQHQQHRRRTKPCRMETCFDYTKCSDVNQQLLVYVYPPDTINPLGNTPPISLNYRKILSAITESRYYTADPERACLFVLGIDTLDRDSLSEDYVRNVPSRLQRLPYWNNGRNHVIFNLYSGTWPDYAENSLGFDTGEAILAKASMSVRQIRPGFDISIPLFHKQHPLRAGNTGFAVSNNFPTNKKYLLAFKGKRYVHGIGSETRNSLFHLHNARDLILVTTCRHGKSWRELQDARCDEDNREYDRYDYETLLLNSTFCLVPRGRRLGSFRFLEALQAGCIPILLSNSWALPFESKIDWKMAAIWADERLLLQVPEIVRSISATKILALRQQTQMLWERYFGSIEKIVFTTFEIIRERLPDYPLRNGLIWNNAPGALLTIPTFADSSVKMPFLLDILNKEPGHNFTAVIFVQIGVTLTPSSALYRLVKTITRSQYVARIIILWASDRPIPSKKRWPNTGAIPMHIISSIGNDERPTISHRFYPHKFIDTDAILSLDEDAILNTDELDFAYRVWRDFPDRIIGYPARAHFWDDSKNAWGYTSKWTNYYSIVLTGAAFYHQYYNYVYTNWLPLLLLKTVQQSSNCEDILMNFLISHVTRKAPIKVTQRKGYKDRESGRSPWNDPDHFIQRQSCLNTFAAVFGYMPLLRSNLRLDPVLYRDSVSNLRKKYRQIELVGS
ncbi:exostosin-1 [Contarinia nasturtii]|uniref:exostosin-1 n=1 Tax=Contarinia nasturtii TaxID=265458 RepID=UPI0012D49A37|nr:exostosin-1 [Contarinia nasturtii]XP_031622047.1 exostosin-1 [Contarinia nasturtii]XP_031622048.1 exostosin-1 [Contarinia nasturtii]XP_031622049.1 exostosin-1 [Contarinia nasturtii]XP_031622050.1 exostosin-1 [Contarinia nasturtii]XP_031622051.1 exostosin-1 [Contarinia nasturtii]